MEGRNGMSMSGSASFYMHRGMAASSSGSPSGLHPLPSPSTTLPVRSTTVSGGPVSQPFQMETSPALSQPGINIVSHTERIKRKRGRPRKYGPEASMSLVLSPLSASGPIAGSGPGSSGILSMPGSASAPQKRGRGRPPGTGRKQQLASCGEWISSSAGMGFTPHVITISAGEDIASKIMSFSQQGPRAVCILSASGVVSTVTLRQPATSGGNVTYEGRFEILSLSGSFLMTDEGGSRSRSGALSVSLSSPDGRVVGGGVAGLLVAATPVQVIVGSFMYGSTKAKSSKHQPPESDGRGSEAAEHAIPDRQTMPPPTSAGGTAANPGLGSLHVGWPGQRPVDLRNPAASLADIDLTRG